jgi:hypothetical protein
LYSVKNKSLRYLASAMLLVFLIVSGIKQSVQIGYFGKMSVQKSGKSTGVTINPASSANDLVNESFFEGEENETEDETETCVDLFCCTLSFVLFHPHPESCTHLPVKGIASLDFRYLSLRILRI